MICETCRLYADCELEPPREGRDMPLFRTEGKAWADIHGRGMEDGGTVSRRNAEREPWGRSEKP